MSSLYILEIRPLSEVSLANMFSHTVGTLFILMVFFFFSHVEAFYFDEVQFVYSFFMSLALGDVSVRICCVEYLRFSCQCILLGLLWCYDLYLSIVPTLNLFLCLV